MNLDLARKEIFALMLKLERSEDLNEIIALQWLIDGKTRLIADVVQLDMQTVETILLRQYADWLQNDGESESE